VLSNGRSVIAGQGGIELLPPPPPVAQPIVAPSGPVQAHYNLRRSTYYTRTERLAYEARVAAGLLVDEDTIDVDEGDYTTETDEATTSESEEEEEEEEEFNEDVDGDEDEEDENIAD